MEQLLNDQQFIQNLVEVIFAILGAVGVSAGAMKWIRFAVNEIGLPILLEYIGAKAQAAKKGGAEKVEIDASEIAAHVASRVAEHLPGKLASMPIARTAVRKGVDDLLSRTISGGHRIKSSARLIARSNKIGIGASAEGDHVKVGGFARIDPRTGRPDFGIDVTIK